MLTLPLVGYDDQLVGVLQVVNRRDGIFDADDEAVAAALAAQCAVALQRMQMTERLVSSEKLRQEISVAREVQMGTLPKAPPIVPGYDFAGLFQPTDDTGGDTYDFVPCDDGRIFVLMGDATGHGIGPALSATQVRAMLRVALRLGASLDDVFRHINDQLVDDLSEDRFVTAFLGQLDPRLARAALPLGRPGPAAAFPGGRPWLRIPSADDLSDGRDTAPGAQAGGDRAHWRSAMCLPWSPMASTSMKMPTASSSASRASPMSFASTTTGPCRICSAG